MTVLCTHEIQSYSATLAYSMVESYIMQAPAFRGITCQMYSFVFVAMD